VLGKNPPRQPVEDNLDLNQTKAPPGEPRPERYLSWRDLFARGVVSSKTSARRLWGRDLFPRPVHLSERVIAWRESEVEAWAASRVHAPQPARGCAAVSQARKAKQDAKTK